jgi:hypothetical protein
MSVCCAGGLTNCGGTCYNLTNDNSHCGDCSMMCDTTTMSCSSSACGCKASYTSCEQRCALNGLACIGNGAALCGVWDFETGFQGVSLNTQTTSTFKSVGVSAASVTTAPGGSHAFTVPFNSTDFPVAVLKIPLCSSRGGIFISGHQLSARIYVAAPSGSFILPYFQAFASDSAGQSPPTIISELDGSIPPGQWNVITQIADSGGEDSTARELDLKIELPKGTGTVYVDDIRLQ